VGFNRRKMEDQRRQAAETEAAARRAPDAQVLEDAERLIAAWNERRAKLFSPTIGAAITAGYWFEKARARTSPQSDHTFKPWGCASRGEQTEVLRISVSARSQFWSASPAFAAQM
jgi:beta-phosphoglucomutase-like phosphatase (HAD superfamily)